MRRPAERDGEPMEINEEQAMEFLKSLPLILLLLVIVGSIVGVIGWAFLGGI